MNRLIGITGPMSSGKTTLCKEILKTYDFVYIDVDIFRRNLYKNKDYENELKSVIKELNKDDGIDSIILNKYIYENEDYMNKYKNVLYKYLFKYIYSFKNKTILVDWALIINDGLLDKFDKVIYVNASIPSRLKRLKESDLSKEEILRRFELQKIDNIESYENENFLIIDNDTELDFSLVENFLTEMECKFTIPNNEGKAIWEITHMCNYSCSYCIFSCNNKKIEGELDTEECFHVIDELVKNNFKHLKFTGGEPFIRKDIIEILKYASDKVVCDISTNASLINESIVEDLNNIKLKMIHVSLDGDKLSHEFVRGKNTYDRTIKGLECLRNSKNKVRIGSVIHSNNENNLEDLVKDSISLNADEIIFSIMEPVSNQDKSNVKTISNEKLCEQIENLKDKYKDKIIVNYNFGKGPSYITCCPGGDKFIYINNYGQISPCTWALEKDKNLLTNSSLRNHTLNELLEEKVMLDFLSKKGKGKCYGKI